MLSLFIALHLKIQSVYCKVVGMTKIGSILLATPEQAESALAEVDAAFKKNETRTKVGSIEIFYAEVPGKISRHFPQEQLSGSASYRACIDPKFIIGTRQHQADCLCVVSFGCEEREAALSEVICISYCVVATDRSGVKLRRYCAVPGCKSSALLIDIARHTPSLPTGEVEYTEAKELIGFLKEYNSCL